MSVLELVAKSRPELLGACIARQALGPGVESRLRRQHTHVSAAEVLGAGGNRGVLRRVGVQDESDSEGDGDDDDDDLGEEDTGEDSEVRREERRELRRVLREHLMRVDGNRAEATAPARPRPCRRRPSSCAP